MGPLTPDDTFDELDQSRRLLLGDLDRLWRRVSDYRFGQMLRLTVDGPGRHPADLTEPAVRAGVARALRETPDVGPPNGPYWDGETSGGGSFLSWRPRDPARITPLVDSLASAWSAHPGLSLGQLVELALERFGMPENEFGTRWLLIEDRPLQRAFDRLAGERSLRELDQ